MKKTFIILCGLILINLLVIISCNREDASTSENQLIIQAEKDAVSEAVLQKVDDQIDKEINNLEKLNYNIVTVKSEQTDKCAAKIVVETPPNSKFPKTITFDFGKGCIDTEGNFRAGKIVVHITGPYWDKNTVRQSKLVDYIFNDLIVVGQRHEINKGKNDKGFYVFEVKHSEKITTNKNVLVVERDWKRERVYNRGKDLTTVSDDEVWITGSAKVEKNGVETIKEITTPLYRQISCPHFQSGVITTIVKKVKINDLDYGKGVCDDIATLNNGKVTKEIKLKTYVNYFAMKQ